MISPLKNKEQILAKLGITELNTMQEEAQLAIEHANDLVLLSPTGSGKTLAFLLPLIGMLNPESEEVQALILVPSRELAIQIEQVAREMGTGYKTNAVYGGRPIAKDRAELQKLPAILIGTPGRVADHLRRRSFRTKELHYLVLDEFDKSLEVGFEEEMSEIVNLLSHLKKRILTSATPAVEIPDFIQLNKPAKIDFLGDGVVNLDIRSIISPTKDKLQTLGAALRHLGKQPGIIFCNYKASIDRVSEYLNELGVPHALFHGGLEQRDRERSLIKFRNGSHQLLLATDLAARGIDVPEIKFIIHYHLPHRAEEFTHRNGRTARMHKEGTAYVLHWEGEELPDFIGELPEQILNEAPLPEAVDWTTVFVSGGRGDKISKGDIAGFFFKQGRMPKDCVGNIELKQDCAFVAVRRNKLKQLIELTDNTHLKKRKVRVYEV
ncbi:DEAD/DEAH box helicase [Lewinella sp. LCG006]|uniref:DEAD/DEAH box helicase n=1 Tax=Lewinella sp. LCG006 TaxID=3231911 RepID=UPI00345F911D